jgi:hypothetical protein
MWHRDPVLTAPFALAALAALAVSCRLQGNDEGSSTEAAGNTNNADSDSVTEADTESGGGTEFPSAGNCTDPQPGEFCFERLSVPDVPPGPLMLAHMNADAHLDAIVVASATDIVVALGDGVGGFVALPPVEVEASLNLAKLVSGRFAGPMAATAVAVYGHNDIAIYVNDGDGRLSLGPSIVSETPFTGFPASVNFDGDGWDDLAIGRGEGVLGFVQNQAGVLSLSDINIPLEACAPSGIGVRGKNSLDIVVSAAWCGGAKDAVPILHIVGPYDGPASIVDSFPSGYDANALAVGPLDISPGDDVVVANRLSRNLTILRAVGDELVADVPIELSQYCDDCEPTSVNVANLDGDEYPELILGASGRTFVLEDALSSLPKWWWLADGLRASAVGDINSDGLDDLVTSDDAFKVFLSAP